MPSPTTTLTQSCNSTVTILNIFPPTGFNVNGGTVTIDSEQITYTTCSDTQLVGCTRGVNSTSPASHAQYAVVTFNSSTPEPDPGKVDSLQADGGAVLNGPVKLASGTGISTSTSGQTITVNSTTGGGITQLTGDVTAGPGSGSQPSTLATVNGNVGSFTNANITVNAKGLITAASTGSSGSTPNIAQANSSTTLITLNSTNTTFTNIPGLSVNFTPSSNTATVKLSLVLNYQSYAYTTQGAGSFAIFNGATNLTPGGATALVRFVHNNTTEQPADCVTAVMSYVPGSTSMITFQVKGKNDSGNGNIDVGSGGVACILIAEEVH